MPERSKALVKAQRSHDRTRDPVRDEHRIVLRLTAAETAALDALKGTPAETRQAVLRRLLAGAKRRR